MGLVDFLGKIDPAAVLHNTRASAQGGKRVRRFPFRLGALAAIFLEFGKQRHNGSQETLLGDHGCKLAVDLGFTETGREHLIGCCDFRR